MAPPSNPCALLDRMFERKPVDLGARARGGSGGTDVVGVQHDKIVLILRGEDALLGQGVVFKAAVAVKVVGRDVEDDSDGGMELLSAIRAGSLTLRGPTRWHRSIRR